MKQNLQAIGGELKTQIKILAMVVSIFWIVFILNEVILEKTLIIANGCGLRRGLNALGIVPHSFIGLRGILFAPFLHGNFYHIVSNTAPFILLGWLVMLRNIKDFYFVSFMSALVGGLGTWLIGRSCSTHIGASGVIFGYFGYLLFRGYFERSFTSILLSLIVGFFYGSLIWGVLPSQPGVSWQAHFFGFVGGVLTAQLLGRQKRRLN